MTDLLSTAQAAEALGVSVRRVRQLIDEGKLSARQVGRDYVIEAAALEGVQVYGKPGRPPNAAQPGDIEMQTKTTRRLNSSVKRDAEKAMGREKKGGKK
jgi:excisionase family DNA binding protein